MKSLNDLKVALISLQQDAERVPPVGLVYLATYLRDNVGLKQQNILVLDGNYSSIEEELKRFSPDIIGLSSMTVDYGKVSSYAKKLKESYNIPIILGGVHISSLPQSLDKVFDLGVIGEGEETLGEIIALYIKRGAFLANDMAKIKGLVFFNKEKLTITPMREPIKDLDGLPLPDFRFLSKNYFRGEEIPSISELGVKVYLMSSRGCPYRCVFCSTSRFWGRMRFHSPDYTARLVKKFISELGADYLKVLDDLFVISPTRLREIKKAFDKYGILEKIKGIECQVRANLINDELCRAMKELKVTTINFGFESGSEKILNWLKQGGVTVEMNKKAIITCKNWGFHIYGSLIYASPGETIKDMEETNKFIDFAINNKARYIWSFIATPFPATPFWDIAIKRGKVNNNMDWNILSHHNIDAPLLLDDSINKEDFKKVFLDGRKKLRVLKIKMVFDFLFKHPVKSMLMVSKEPLYYGNRVFKQILRQ